MVEQFCVLSVALCDITKSIEHSPLKNPTVSRLVNKFSIFYGTGKFIAVLKRVRYCLFTYAR